MGFSISQSEESVAPELIEEIAQKIVGKKLAMPAILMLEAHRPLGGLFSHFALAFRPLLAMFLGADRAATAAQFAQSPAAIELLINKIEELEKNGWRG